MRIQPVTLLLLLAGLSSAHAATETQISQTTFDPAPHRVLTAAASSGNGYLVVWGASSTPNDDVLNEPPMTIYIRAVGGDGVPLQSFATALGTGQDPSVVWNGHEYLVVWGITSPTTGSVPTPSVVGVRVREDGSLADTQPVTLVSEVNPFSYLTTLSWNGSEYLVGWTRGMALVDADLHAKVLSLPPIGGLPFYSASSGGDFLIIGAVFITGQQTLVIAPVSSAGSAGAPIILDGPHAAVVGIDGGYALIWDDRTNLRYARLRPDGTMLSSSILAFGHTARPSIATRNGAIVATWSADSNSIVCTARHDINVQPVCSDGLQHDPSIALASTSVLSVWSDHAASDDTVRVVVTPSSDLPRAGSSAGRTLSDLPQLTPAAGLRADGSLAAAWSEYNLTTKHFEVHIGGLSSKGAKLPEHVVFPTTLDQGSPAVAAGTGRTMVVWPEGPASSSKIRAAVVDDLSGAVIGTLPLAAGIAPSAAFDGQEWLVAWQSADGINRFAFVNNDGNPIATGAMPAISVVQSPPAVAWSGKVFFATWRETVPASPGLPAYDRIQFTAINAFAVPSASLTLDFASSLTQPSVASNGSRMLVSWGAPSNTLRQALFDSSARQLGRFIDLPSPSTFTRTRTRTTAGGFATLAGTRIALTSADGVALGTMDVPSIASGADFIVDSANRITFLYSRAVGNANATFVQIIGMPRRRP